MTKFEKIKIGDKAVVKHTITHGDIDKFVQMTGDDNKLHIDDEFAKRTSYKKTIAHGMLSASFISTLIGTKLPGDGAVWVSQSLEFLIPVRVGDEITAIAEVIKKIEREQIIDLKTDVLNQYKQKVITGVAKVKVIEPQITESTGEIKQLEKVAAVIGATGGIGRATCLQLAKDGFDIVIHYHKNSELAFELKEQVEKIGQKALIVSSDITDISQVAEMVSKVERTFSSLSALINCTTIMVSDIKFPLLEWEDIQKHLDINIKGAFCLINKCLPLLEKSKKGKIVHITTRAIESPGGEGLPYITAKSALNGFSKALAVELAIKGICVNMVSPGMTDTELIADIPEKVRLVTAAKTPLKRLARPEDIAGAISFLVSDRADYLTGETIRVNGGQVMI